MLTSHSPNCKIFRICLLFSVLLQNDITVRYDKKKKGYSHFGSNYVLGCAIIMLQMSTLIGVVCILINFCSWICLLTNSHLPSPAVEVNISCLWIWKCAVDCITYLPVCFELWVEVEFYVKTLYSHPIRNLCYIEQYKEKTISNVY